MYSSVYISASFVTFCCKCYKASDTAQSQSKKCFELFFWEFWERELNAAAPKNRANYKDTQSLRTCLLKLQNPLSEPLKLLFQVSSLSIDHEVLFIKVQSLKIILPMNIANEAFMEKNLARHYFVNVGLD